MPGVRKRSQEAVRQQLADDILAVYLERGFAETTVEDVSQAVGVSRATFFRYFISKEEAVYVAVEGRSADFASLFTDLQRHPGEDDWALYRRALDPVISAADANPERSRARTQLMRSNPSLLAFIAGRRLSKQHDVAEALERAGVDGETARILAATAGAAFDLAWEEWPLQTGSSFTDVVDRVFMSARRMMA